MNVKVVLWKMPHIDTLVWTCAEFNNEKLLRVAYFHTRMWVWCIHLGIIASSKFLLYVKEMRNIMLFSAFIEPSYVCVIF